MSNFEMVGGIYLVQGPHELDLHNVFDFKEVRYSVAERTVSLLWEHPSKTLGDNDPAKATITFEGVREFRFRGRDSEMPFTEDDCLSAMGYQSDQPWSEGNVLLSEDTEEDWLHAFEFQSGALIAVRADRANARIYLKSEVVSKSSPGTVPRAP